MKITLLVPPSGYLAERWSKGSTMPPLGIGYLAAVLEKEGYEVSILDSHIEELSKRGIVNKLREYKPDVVGVTFTTENRFEGFDTIELAKKALPDGIVVAGGPHVTLAADDTLKNVKSLDIIVRGEGEYSFLELIKAIEKKSDLRKVSGISFRDGKDIIHTPAHLLIMDLDEIPFPARHLYKIELYNFFIDVPGRGKLKAGNIMTSRGCPFRCNFCATPSVWGSKCRVRSPENVIAEIEQMVSNYRIEGLWVFDDTFNASKKRTAEICELMIEKKLNLSWFCEIRVDLVDRELLKLMKEAGCYYVGFGVESGSARILDKVIQKRITLEQIDEVRIMCKEAGIIANPFFILSHPGETWDEAQKTLELMKKWSSEGSPVSISLLHIYPGTRLEQMAYQMGVLPKDFSWSNRKEKRIYTLPSSQGDVPIFLDKLTWEQVSELLFQWAGTQKYSIIRKIPRALRSIRSFGDLKRYYTMFRVYCKNRLSQIGAGVNK